MSDAIPEGFRDLFAKKVFAHLATVMPDGRPQVTPVWCDLDGGMVRINTAIGRQKDRNLMRDGRVALSLIDPENPYRYLEVRGTSRSVPKRAPIHISISSRRSTWANPTRTDRRQKSACCSVSSRNTSLLWGSGHAFWLPSIVLRISSG